MTIEKNALLQINRKEHPVGSVVFFLRSRNGRKYVSFGTVEENFTSEICVQLYDFRERRLIDGKPVSEMDFPTRWQKLPKNWSYVTELFTLSYTKLGSSFLMTPDGVLDAIRSGVLVKVQTLSYGTFEAVIDKNNGWRIEHKHPYGEYHPAFISLRHTDAYDCYADAQSALDAELREFKRQSELSDYDWSLEKIDDTLGFWAKQNGITEEEKKRYRDRILSIDRLEDVEIRTVSGRIQWKYWKNQRWMDIAI